MKNIPLFIAFRVLFNARWYYPVMAVLFLDLGLTITEFAVLNVVWAIAIVCLELPSGAVADQIGRRKMVVLAGWLMVVEMMLLAFAPAGSAWLFPILILNRILSGAAEASASGADEALAYDSLVDAGRASEWPGVLATLMRWQAVGFFVAMMVGAALYDATVVGYALRAIGIDTVVSSEVTLRIPLVMSLGNAVLVLIIAMRMQEPVSGHSGVRVTVRGTLAQTSRAARWIWSQPSVVFILCAGLCLDSVIRMFLTVNSNYYRLIGMPEAAFGLIASALAVIGFFTPRLSKALVGAVGLAANFGIAAVFALLGLSLAAGFFPVWGVVVVLPIGVAMSMLGFFCSHYLNTIVSDSSLRTTVLSFKGLVFNLAYGAVGALFAGFTGARAGVLDQDAVFMEVFGWAPMFLVVILIPILFLGWRVRGCH